MMPRGRVDLHDVWEGYGMKYLWGALFALAAIFFIIGIIYWRNIG